MFFAFWLIIESVTEKVLQFRMQLKSIYNKNLGFIEQKNVFLNATERFKQEKGYLIDIIFAMKFFFYWPFQRCPL
jgi:hypothetical protein